jgi:hypothetical protein
MRVICAFDGVATRMVASESGNLYKGGVKALNCSAWHIAKMREGELDEISEPVVISKPH